METAKVRSGSLPNTQDGWGTEEDSNSIAVAAKQGDSNGKGKVMGGGFWGDDPSSTIVTDVGSHNAQAQV